MTSYICTCSYISYSFQKILDLPILLPEKIKNIDLNILLNMYFDYEEIQFGSKCEKCNKISEHKKKLFFTRIPKILLLSL